MKKELIRVVLELLTLSIHFKKVNGACASLVSVFLYITAAISASWEMARFGRKCHTRQKIIHNLVKTYGHDQKCWM